MGDNLRMWTVEGTVSDKNSAFFKLKGNKAGYMS